MLHVMLLAGTIPCISGGRVMNGRLSPGVEACWGRDCTFCKRQSCERVETYKFIIYVEIMIDVWNIG